MINKNNFKRVLCMLLSVLLITASPYNAFCDEILQDETIEEAAPEVLGDDATESETTDDETTSEETVETAEEEEETNPYLWDSAWDEYLSLSDDHIIINSPIGSGASISLTGMEESGLDVSGNDGCYDGLSDGAYFSYPIDDLVYCYLSDDGTIYVYPASDDAEGSIDVSLTIREKKFTFTVDLYSITLNRYVINTYKGSATKQLKLYGNSSSNKVVWSSSNRSVARVSSSGVVTIKGIGTSLITATCGDVKVTCLVSVSSKIAYRAVKKARKLSLRNDIYYSQPKRMLSHYYDCSSMVWRVYKSVGLNICNNYSYNAPVAAGEAYWCACKNKTLKKSSWKLSKRRLVGGDLIFYSYNGNNGRYLNIDHVAMFASYYYDKSSDSYYATVIEASSTWNKVNERNYFVSDYMVLAARPTR
ncbi:MAG: Ig-like domain-containing protein [Eubacterium sp.]|nr:Ig-like domain-containing protein [Eubacterium sp.]